VTEAVIGLLGVVIGVLLGGGVRVMVAWVERRAAARRAIRSQVSGQPAPASAGRAP